MRQLPITPPPRRMVIGVSGASGAAYGVRLLEVLREAGIETHLAISKAAIQAIQAELDLSLDEVRRKADHIYSNADIGARIASGSFRTLGMVVAPCSIRTLSDIAYGTTDTLISRAGDVTLKERRRLVLMVRETPLHLGHLRAMTQVTEMGAVVMPPVPALYNRPDSVQAIVDHSVGRVLDLFDIDVGLVEPWDGVRANSPAED
jgi:flavin prenyltransferase